jgi:hypothetical protein
VLRDRTTEAPAALIQLPPAPPSHEVTLQDVPVEAESEGMTLTDASPEASQFYPARDPSAGSASESSQTDHSDISFNELDRAFGTFYIMSPGNPPPQQECQPEYKAAMTEELQRLRAEMDQLCSARQTESMELQNLRAMQVANVQALERAEASLTEESWQRKKLENAAAQAPKPHVTAPALS